MWKSMWKTLRSYTYIRTGSREHIHVQALVSICTRAYMHIHIYRAHICTYTFIARREISGRHCTYNSKRERLFDSTIFYFEMIHHMHMKRFLKPISAREKLLGGLRAWSPRFHYPPRPNQFFIKFY